MRIRQFIAAIMILLSLSAQARTGFACGMMPGAVLDHCCCPADGRDQCPPGASAKHCCDLVAPGDAPLSQLAASIYDRQHAPINPLDLPPVAAVDAWLLPAAFDTGGRIHAFPEPVASRHRLVPLYLQTARLRL